MVIDDRHQRRDGVAVVSMIDYTAVRRKQAALMMLGSKSPVCYTDTMASWGGSIQG